MKTKLTRGLFAGLAAAATMFFLPAISSAANLVAAKEAQPLDTIAKQWPAPPTIAATTQQNSQGPDYTVINANAAKKLDAQNPQMSLFKTSTENALTTGVMTMLMTNTVYRPTTSSKPLWQDAGVTVLGEKDGLVLVKSGILLAVNYKTTNQPPASSVTS